MCRADRPASSFDSRYEERKEGGPDFRPGRLPKVHKLYEDFTKPRSQIKYLI